MARAPTQGAEGRLGALALPTTFASRPSTITSPQETARPALLDCRGFYTWSQQRHGPLARRARRIPALQLPLDWERSDFTSVRCTSCTSTAATSTAASAGSQRGEFGRVHQPASLSLSSLPRTSNRSCRIFPACWGPVALQFAGCRQFERRFEFERWARKRKFDGSIQHRHWSTIVEASEERVVKRRRSTGGCDAEGTLGQGWSTEPLVTVAPG